jgi:H+/Cl- antiporter ClcA
MIWRVFFCSAISTFVLGTLQAIVENGFNSNIDLSSSAVLKFGKLTEVTLRVQDIPGIIIISAVCGCLGSMFIHVNTLQNMNRPKYIKQNWQKVIETAVYACATISTFYWVTAAFHDCNSAAGIDEEELKTVRFTCPEGEFSPMASLFFNTEGGTIRYFLKF